MSTGLPTIYLDTCVFQPKLWGTHEQAEVQMSEDIIGSLRGQVSRDNVEVVIPQLAIGEAFSNFWNDYLEYGEPQTGPVTDMGSELDDLIDQLNARICHVTTDAFETARELHERDNRLGGNDALIAGCALEDRWSQKMLSFDGHFIDSDAIAAVNDDRLPQPRIYSLSVSSEF